MKKTIEISVDGKGGCEVDVIRPFDFDAEDISFMLATIIYTMTNAIEDNAKEQFMAEVSDLLNTELMEGNIHENYKLTSENGDLILYEVQESDKVGKRITFEGDLNECIEYCRGLDLPEIDEPIGFYTDGRVSYQILEV